LLRLAFGTAAIRKMGMAVKLGTLFSRGQAGPRMSGMPKLLCLFSLLWLVAAPLAAPAPETALPAAPSAVLDDPLKAMQQFRLPPGFKAELFAAEPHLSNPVAFSIDEQGDFYIAETHRHSAVGPAFRYFDGVLDIRSHLDWLDEDLALRSVPERTEMLTRRLGANLYKFTEKSEVLRLVQDKNRDGKADSSSTFAAGFNHIPDGIAAGVLARGGQVWFASIPELWRLKDTNGDGKADERAALHTGYGVHISFIGHDLHGLILGPDGRLYFSIGDRGLNVTNREGRVLDYPDEGVVLRCEPDGANLEVFARGLRNPQELVFDDLGNLFTGDNNSDGGDRARWVYVVEGGDSGWRIGYQHLHAPPRRGPWNAEKLWYPQWEGQAAWILPPIANLGYGPSGVAFYPGTGLPEKYAGHFFLCDFRGGASSGIHAFTMKAKGAGFELGAYEQFVWEALPTDAEFGPDGALYFTDWIQGWNRTGKGRIFRVAHPESRNAPIVAETARLIREGMAGRPLDELFTLLGHADMRVRQEAQFELARRGTAAAERLQQAAKASSSDAGIHARLHALWALGQLARAEPARKEALLEPVAPLLGDPLPEIRAQTARLLGDARFASRTAGLMALLEDPAPRAQLQAALALARIASPDAAAALLALLKQNGDRDPFIRHAAASALAASLPAERLAQLAPRTAAEQMGVLLALRRLESPLIAQFLGSTNLALALEAARAINDAPITNAIPQLAELIEQPERFEATATNRIELAATGGITENISGVAAATGTATPYEQLFQRVINANFRAQPRRERELRKHAARLAEFAANPKVPAGLRAEALQALADWPAPGGRDRIMGLWRPLPARPREIAAKELAGQFDELLQKSPEPVQLAALDAAQKLHADPTVKPLLGMVRNTNAPAAVRVASLRNLAALKSRQLEPALAAAQASGNALLAAESRLIRARRDPAGTAADLRAVLKSGEIPEKQQVFATLGQIQSPEFAALLADQAAALIAGKARPELELDILDAAAKQGTPELLALVQKFETARPKTVTAPFREVLRGGDAAAGKAIFFERAEVFCSRCHTVGYEGGQAGPSLTGIGAKKSRDYLLESIVFPNKEIAQGWENVLISLNDGSSLSGSVQSETPAELVINSPEDGEVRLKKTDIKSRERALSGMPEEFRQILTKQDLRNLVEFLASQK